MSTNNKLPKVPKIRRYHWYTAVIFFAGTLVPPLAVAARFGIGKDFWLNVLLTIAGYIPGHVHNFYIQNVRNNKTHQRTPKWALRYGLVDGSVIKRHEKRSQWAGKYNDRNPDGGYDQQPLEEGQVGPSRTATSDSADNNPRNGDGLWRPDDESYYSAEREDSLHTAEAGTSKRWRYPANFDESLPDTSEATVKKKKKKKDRWARTEDAYTAPEQKKKKKKKSKSRSTVGDAEEVGSGYSHRAESAAELDVPEEATGQSYGRREEENTSTRAAGVGNEHTAVSREEEFNHQF